MPDSVTFAIIGATGAVGREALAILAQRAHPVDHIRAITSDRSAGTQIPYAGSALTAEEFDADQLADVDCALLCTDATTSRRVAPCLVQQGVLVIDNSSAFRHDPRVPLVIPEINAAELQPESTIIANPNCSTIILLLATHPLRAAFGLREIVVSTYQAVSGAGLAAIDELRRQTHAALESRVLSHHVFPQPCAFNVFPHESTFDPATGFNGEEQKIISESRRILADPSLSIMPNCVRVPVERAHSQSILVTLEQPATLQQVRACLAAAPGLRWIDDQTAPTSPTPQQATGIDPVLVGRVRRADAGPDESSQRFMLWVCGDQLRKGAALNALQIADLALNLRARSPRALPRALDRPHAHLPTPIEN
jgi:aspartate-semialdehyde dehydrogenase